jgi:protein O-GlcNAc transferase
MMQGFCASGQAPFSLSSQAPPVPLSARAMLEQAKALSSSGRLQEAFELSQVAAQRLGDSEVPVQVECMCMQASVLLRPENGAKTADAEKLLRRAVELDSEHTEVNFLMAACAKLQVRIPECVGHLKKAFALSPERLDIKDALGMTLIDAAMAVHAQGRTDDAIAQIKEAIVYVSDPSHAHFQAGVMYAQSNRQDLALEQYKLAAARGWHADAMNNAGAIYRLDATISDSSLAESKAFFEAALRASPTHLLARKNLSQTLCLQANKMRERGDSKVSKQLYKEALHHQSDNTDAIVGLGLLKASLHKFKSACTLLEWSIHFKPTAEAYNALGVLYREFSLNDKSCEAFMKALSLKPTSAEALMNVCSFKVLEGKMDEALPYGLAAIQIAPSYSDAYVSLGRLFQDGGEIEKSIESYQKAIQLNPTNHTASHNMLFTSNYSIKHATDEISAFHLEWGQAFARANQPRVHTPAGRYSSDPSSPIFRRLRVGYIGPDFNLHSVSFFSDALFRYANKVAVHNTVFFSSNRTDFKTQEFKNMTDEWVDIYGKSAADVAALIARHEIDVLVELAGHTASNRLDVMSLRPAPVQLTYLGYPNTTGLPTIDYRICDSLSDPVTSTQRFSERLLRLNRCFIAYRPIVSDVPVSPSPCFSCGYVTFGTFNNLSKINSSVLTVWARILLAVPHSRLLLKSKCFTSREIQQRIISHFETFGLLSNRITMSGMIPDNRAHLASYGQLDIALDVFPYAGTTTTCETLWMGVPTVTLRGDCHACNVGVSLLSAIGCPEWIASSAEQYMYAISLSQTCLLHSRQLTRSTSDPSPARWLAIGRRSEAFAAPCVNAWHRA